MATSAGNIDVYKVSLGDILIFSKISVENDIVYTAGNTVTYYVDSNISYQEEVDADDTVLSPKTFIPTKSGWEFVGWRQDTTASSTVLNSLTMGDDPITLYAVFRQVVTVTYYNGNTTKQTASGYRYYNNSNIVNPTFTIAQTALSGWTPRGWSIGTTGNAAISYTAISNTAFSADTTIYGMYQQTITLTLYNGSATASKPTGTRYYNSGANTYVNPTFTVAAASISGWSFRGWSTSSAGNGAISYSTLSNTVFAANATLYALYQQTITLSYNGNGNTSGSTAAQSGMRYYSSAGTYVNPAFTVAANSFVKTSYTFVQWRLNGTGGTAYAPGTSITLTANATLYAEWRANPVPYYIVQNRNCVYNYSDPTNPTYSVLWLCTYHYNMDGTPGTCFWKYGNQSSNLQARSGSSMSNYAITYENNRAFPTQNCTTLEVYGFVISDNTFTHVYISINGGAEKEVTDYTTVKFDITNTSSIKMKIRITSVLGSTVIGFAPLTLRLY